MAKKRSSKIIRLILKLSAVGTLGFFFPWIMLPYVVLGLYDVGRHDSITPRLLNNYFFSKGTFLWLMSPINTLIDILALPYINKKIYKPEDLPKDYQEEIETLISSFQEVDYKKLLPQETSKHKRSMVFYKWYLENQKTDIEIPVFHQNFKYISTIGISIFNAQTATTRHFGPIRPSLRMLYLLNESIGENAFINVDNHYHKWEDDRLFIFDDTIVHKSVNYTDDVRYCMFVDIIRPSKINFAFRAIIRSMNLITRFFNSLFIRNWKKI